MHEREPAAEPEATAAPERSAPANAALAGAVLMLQRSAGNAAVAHAAATGALPALAGRVLGRQTPTVTTPPVPAGALPLVKPDLGRKKEYDKAVELLQSKLNWHLGFLGHTLLIVDGHFGGQTARAVRQVKRAYKVKPADEKVDAATWALLDAPPQKARTEKGPGPDYGELLKDGLLDVTMAMGFDEHGRHKIELPQIRMGLVDVRGFKLDAVRAAEIRKRARASGMGGGAQPSPAPPGTEEWYVKEAVGMQGNVVVHCVIRLVIPADDTASGAAATESALRGMNEGDAFLYAGHGRYGTGMDYDYKYRFEIDWDRHPAKPEGRSGKQVVDHLEELIQLLKLGNNDQAQIKRYKQLRDAGAVRQITHHEGNIRINERAAAKLDATFSGWLMSESVQPAAKPIPGRVQEDRHRVWLFNGCTTKHYVDALRESKSANLAEGNLGIHGTVEPSYGNVRSESLLTYLDGLLARETAEALKNRLSSAQAATGMHVGYLSSGFKK